MIQDGSPHPLPKKHESNGDREGYGGDADTHFVDEVCSHHINRYSMAKFPKVFIF